MPGTSTELVGYLLRTALGDYSPARTNLPVVDVAERIAVEAEKRIAEASQARSPLRAARSCEDWAICATL